MAAALVCLPCVASHAQDSCGAGKDLVVQALERVRADSTPDQLIDADSYLKRAVEVCSELGDAWYYRSLLERKLGHGPVADYAMRQARMFPSQAMKDGLNPLVLAAPKETKPPGPIQQKWALIIGVGHFKDTSIPTLRYASSDAQGFENSLLNQAYGHFAPDHVHLLLDSAATTAGIKEGLNWLARMAGPDDLVVVYIASHGSERELDTAGANYIMTFDTELGEEQNPDTLYATAYPMEELSNAIATRVRARRAAVFIDTCYSGNAAAGTAAAIRSASVSAATLEQASQGAGRIVVAASRTDQPSLESPQLGHGYFTYYLMDALQQLGPTAPVSGIFSYVSTHVAERVASDFRAFPNRYAQNPVMSRSTETTDFPLGAPAQPASATRAPAAETDGMARR